MLKIIWITFGRTVKEVSLKAFADFTQQILYGMLNGNFRNTSGSHFMPLLYRNWIVTDNALSNLNQSTGNRLKLITWFPVNDK